MFILTTSFSIYFGSPSFSAQSVHEPLYDFELEIEYKINIWIL